MRAEQRIKANTRWTTKSKKMRAEQRMTTVKQILHWTTNWATKLKQKWHQHSERRFVQYCTKRIKSKNSANFLDFFTRTKRSANFLVKCKNWVNFLTRTKKLVTFLGESGNSANLHTSSIILSHAFQKFCNFVQNWILVFNSAHWTFSKLAYLFCSDQNLQSQIRPSEWLLIGFDGRAFCAESSMRQISCRKLYLRLQVLVWTE